MKHSQYREKLQLLHHEELDPSERTLVEEHLLDCSECRNELARLMQLNSILLEHGAPIQVDEKLLREARQQFREVLRGEISRRRYWEEMAEWISLYFAPRYQIALGALATLAIGILVGHHAFPPSTPQTAGTEAQSIPGDSRIANVRFLDAGRGSEMVEFTYDAVRPVRMKGSVNDPQIQKVLTHAMLNDENPGVRLRAVYAIAAPQVNQPDREIKTALILALKTDPNAGVRKEALHTLQRYPPDNDIKNALLNTLMTDKNPGLRIAAINGLDSLRAHGQVTDQSVLNTLRDKSRSDENNYIRLRARTVLQEVKAQ